MENSHQGIEIENPPSAPRLTNVNRLIHLLFFLTVPLVLFSIFTFLNLDKAIQCNVEKIVRTSSLDTIANPPTTEFFNLKPHPKFSKDYSRSIPKSLNSVRLDSVQTDLDVALDENMPVAVVLIQITLPEFLNSESDAESENYYLVGDQTGPTSQNEREIPTNIWKLLGISEIDDSSEINPTLNLDTLVLNLKLEGLGYNDDSPTYLEAQHPFETYLRRKKRSLKKYYYARRERAGAM